MKNNLGYQLKFLGFRIGRRRYEFWETARYWYTQLPILVRCATKIVKVD